MKRLIHFFFYFFSLAFSSIFAEQDPFSATIASKAVGIANIESEPSGIIDGCVNVITGEFIDFDVDLVIPGPEPLKIERYLSGNNPHPDLNVCGPHMNFSQWADLYIKHSAGNAYMAFFNKGLESRSTFYITEEKKKDSEGLLIHKQFLRQCTNTSKGGISAQTNPLNRRCFWNHDAQSAHLTMENGANLFFKEDKTTKLAKHCHRMLLQKETLPCGLTLNYDYENWDLVSVILKNKKNQELSSYKIEEFDSYNPHKIVACDGRFACYEFEPGDHPLIKSVVRSDAPRIDYSYYPSRSYSIEDLPVRLVNNISINFTDKPKIFRKSYPHERYKEIVYYTKGMSPADGQAVSTLPHESHFRRVSQLIAPLGPTPAPHLKYKFIYHLPDGHDGGGCAGVYDARNHKTDYNFNHRQRLTSITKYFASGSPYSKESLYWGPQNDTTKAMRLVARSFKIEGASHDLFARVYSYDNKGNVLTDSLYGNIQGISQATLTVSRKGVVSGGGDCYQKTYSYSNDEFHLLTESIEGEIRKTFEYLPGSNLLTACFHHNQTGVFLRHFYSYDHNALMIEHIVDDGSSYDRNQLTHVTERKIEKIERTTTYPVGLPKVIQELYYDHKSGGEKLFRRKVNQHDDFGRLIRQETYDEKNQFAYAEEWTYDAHGNVIQEVNRLGQCIIREFDDLDNMTYLKGVDGRLEQRFTYDYMNRVIRIDEFHPDGTFSKHFHYDLCGNPIETVDVLGNSTHTEYDEFNRPVRVIGTPVVNGEGQLHRPVISYEYDPLGNPTKLISPEGDVTEFAYTLIGKPYYIRYPDGSTEHFEYDLEGRLTKEIAKTGVLTRYKHDYQGRVIRKECFSKDGSFLFKTEARYDNLHLKEEIDAAGTHTSYTYDALGRKSTVTRGDLLTTYGYDLLGRLVKTTLSSLSHPEEGSVQSASYDVMDRIVEERTETCSGKVLTCVRYRYDEAGNKSRIEQEGEAGISITKIEYDTHGIPVRTVDPEGNITFSRTIFDYYNAHGQNVLVIEGIDPLGISTLSIQDAQGRVVEALKKNPFGDVLQKTEFQRDTSGRCIETVETVYLPDRSTREIINRFEYDCMGRQVAALQACGTPEEKHSTVSYNNFGQKIAEMKPSGESLLYSYDSMGRLKDYRSTDGSIHYRYTYDICSNPIRVENLIDHNTTYRIYDMHQRVIEEKLANSLALKMSYTPDGFLKTLCYPDGSSVKYTYDASILKRVDRFRGEELSYTHEYCSHDLSGRLLKSALIHDLGEITHCYNSKGQFTEIASPYYQETLSEAYDALGNLLKRSYHDPVGKEDEEFTYDPLSQLTSEKSHTYTYDSIHNRCSKDGRVHTHNALNQLLSDGETTFTYDLNLNRSHAAHPESAHAYTYDALDRLKALQIGSDRYEFFYDEHNRCITQKLYQSDQLVKTENLLYMGQDDVGTADERGNIHTLRILGKGLGAEIGAAVALEIQGQTYAPLHDHNGNVAVLVDTAGIAVESYRYTAFGEEEIFDSNGKLTSQAINPWRFASKRHQGDYLLFGRRFYDPAQGRWLTPDPMGYSAGPNLYAFVGNNPLTHFDLYGLFDDAEPSFFDRICDSISSAWSSVRDSVTSSFESVRDSGASLLQNINDAHSYCYDMLSSITRNSILMPIERDLVSASFYYAAHGTVDGYPFSWAQEHSQYVDGPGEHNFENLRIIGLNGINTSLSYFKETLSEHSELFGTRVDGNYNSTTTVVFDFFEVVCEKMGITVHCVEVAVQGIRLKIQEVDSRGIVATIGHSQGGQTLECALKQLTREEKSITAVCTVGSAKIIRDPDLLYVINYISEGDPVPLIGDPINYALAKCGLVPEVVFLPNRESLLFDHDVRGVTYEGGLKRFKDDLFELRKSR